MRIIHRLRHAWESFAERTGLRLLPPVGTAVAVLALGVLIPFLPRVDALPPQLAPTLASARLARFLRSHPDLPDAGPSGPIYSVRPAFYWPERPGAANYSFRLHGADGTELAAAKGIKNTFHIVPPPGRLNPGEYRFEVRAVVNGEEVPWQERVFTVRDTPEGLRELLASTGIDLDGSQREYVLIGYYADLQSPHDVISAFLQWKTALGEASSIGNGPPAMWLKTLHTTP